MSLTAANTSWVFSPDSSVISCKELDPAAPLLVEDHCSSTSLVPFRCARQDPSHLSLLIYRGSVSVCSHPQRVSVESTGRNWACRLT